MKRFIVCLIIFGLLIAGYFICRDNTVKDESLTKIKVAEVTHSVFYAPQYAAHALGYFEDEALDVEIILTAGVDNKYYINF